MSLAQTRINALVRLGNLFNYLLDRFGFRNMLKAIADTTKVNIAPKPNIILSIGNLVINDIREPLPEKPDDSPNKLIHAKIDPMMDVRT